MIVRAALVPLILAGLLFVLVWAFWGFSWFLLLVLILLALLYRKPARELVCTDKKAILAPIDGRVISLKNITHKDLGECVEVVIKNLFYEAGSIYTAANFKVEKISARHGLFLPTSLELSSNFNERLFILANCQGVRFGMRIGAGSLDRGLLLDPIKESYQAGEALSFTLNGQVSLLLPKSSRLLISSADELKANTLLGYFS